jgi:hypothetical protein
MQKLVFRNANGIELDLTSDPFGITEWEGFSADDLNIQSQQVPFQDGDVYLDALLGERTLSVTVAMNDGNYLERRYQLRREMISKLNPKLGEGVLIYTNDFLSKQIHCIPQLPVFQNKNSNDSGTPKVSCSFTACNPYWEDLEDTNISINNGIIEIENNGDVPADFEMSLMSDADFSVENKTENKIIEVTNTEKRIINISTKAGEKSANKISCNIVAQKLTSQIGKVAYSPKIDTYLYSGYIYKNGFETEIEEYGKPYYVGALDLFFMLNGSTIKTSQNAEDWTTVYTGDKTLNALFYSSDFSKVCVVGNEGLVLSSSDGVTFSALTSGTTENLYCICDMPLSYWDNKGLYFGGANGKLLKTEDGTTIESSGVAFEFDILSIAVDTARKIGLMGGSDGNLYEYTSDWQQMTVDTNYDIIDLYFYNGYFYGLTGQNNIKNVIKGLNTFEVLEQYAKNISFSKELNMLYFGSYGRAGLSYLENNEFKFVGLGYPSAKRIKYIKERDKLLILNSYSIAIANKDFSNYEIVFETENNIAFFDAVWNENKVIAIGIYLYESEDLRTWTKIDTGQYTNFSSGAWSKRYNCFYFSNYNGCYKLTNNTFTSILQANDQGLVLAWAEDKNILVILTTNYGSSARVYSEDGGETFQPITLVGGDTHFREVYYSEEKGMFIAGGHDSPSLYSYDGKTFFGGNYELGELGQVEWYSKMQLFLIMNSGYLYLSPDGINVIETNYYLGDSYAGYFEIVDDKIYCPVNGFLILEFEIGENIISQLSKNSDLGMKLKNGTNKIIVSSISSVAGSLSFRQKYVGV